MSSKITQNHLELVKIMKETGMAADTMLPAMVFLQNDEDAELALAKIQGIQKKKELTEQDIAEAIYKVIEMRLNEQEEML